MNECTSVLIPCSVCLLLDGLFRDVYCSVLYIVCLGREFGGRSMGLCCILKS